MHVSERITSRSASTASPVLPLFHRHCHNSGIWLPCGSGLTAPLHFQFPTSTAYIQLLLLSSSRCMAGPLIRSSRRRAFCFACFSPLFFFFSSFSQPLLAGTSAPPCRHVPSIELRSRLVSPRLQATLMQCASPLPLLFRWGSSSSNCICLACARSLAPQSNWRLRLSLTLLACAAYL